MSTLTDRKNAAISRGVGMTTQIYADRAENAEIWDKEGNRYIDFAAGIAGRACGGQLRVGGVAGIQRSRGAKVRVHAHAREGKLHHMRAANDGGARFLQAGDRGGGVLGQWRILQNPGAGSAARVFQVKQILDGNSQASQWGGARRFCGSPAGLVKKSLAENMGAKRALRRCNAQFHEAGCAFAPFSNLKSCATEVILHGSVLKFCGFAKGWPVMG